MVSDEQAFVTGIHPAVGEPLEGLYFARSDCSSRLIAAAGSVLTDYNLHTAAIWMT